MISAPANEDPLPPLERYSDRVRIIAAPPRQSPPDGPLVLGVDAGSTTTKAVLLDTETRIIGRGITNSRSNYDVACAVARAEAFLSARLARVENALAAALPAAEAQAVRPHIESAMRLAQYRGQLERLREVLADEAREPRHAPYRATLGALLEDVSRLMQERAGALFEPGWPRRSDFFRDLAAAEFLGLAVVVNALQLKIRTLESRSLGGSAPSSWLLST